MTNTELAQRAILLINGGMPSPSPWLNNAAEVGLAISYAMHEVAQMIADDRARAGLLMQDYSVALTSGVGDPLAATGSQTSAADILYETIPMGLVKDADGNRLIQVPDYYEFQGYLLPGYKYFNLSNKKVYARSAVTGDYSSDLGDVTSPLVLTANFVPTVTSLPTQLDDDAVRILARILVEKFPQVESIPDQK